MKQKRRICLIGNGEMPQPEVMKIALGGVDMIVAVDGGSGICRELNIVPDVIIGDFDSLPEDIGEIFPAAEMVTAADQNFSDMEKALVYALKYKPERINIMSATGKRSDHYLANLLCFDKFAAEHEGIELFIYDNFGVMRFLGVGTHLFQKRKGKTVSFFSLASMAGLTMQGFRYNLQQESFSDKFTGLSNVYEADECLVEFAKGRLIWYECF